MKESKVLKSLRPLLNTLSPFHLPSTTLNRVVAQLLEELEKIASLHVPLLKNANRMKRWWSKDLSLECNTLQHLLYAWQLGRTQALLDDYKQAKKSYAKSIAVAKQEHFTTYME